VPGKYTIIDINYTVYDGKPSVSMSKPEKWIFGKSVLCPWTHDPENVINSGNE